MKRYTGKGRLTISLMSAMWESCLIKFYIFGAFEVDVEIARKWNNSVLGCLVEV